MVVRTLWIGTREDARFADAQVNGSSKSPIFRSMRDYCNKLRTTLKVVDVAIASRYMDRQALFSTCSTVTGR